jgi:hypothetical protein
MAEQQTIDVTGLPEMVVTDLQRLVDGLRGVLPPVVPSAPTRDQRIAAWKAWVLSHRDVTAIADDSRESIYEDR